MTETVTLDKDFCFFLMANPSHSWDDKCCKVLWNSFADMPATCPVPTNYDHELRQVYIDTVIVDGHS